MTGDQLQEFDRQVRRIYGSEEGLCLDGVLYKTVDETDTDCLERWEEEHPKILFLLKESYGGFYNIRKGLGHSKSQSGGVPTESFNFASKGKSHNFWPNLCAWRELLTRSARAPEEIDKICYDDIARSSCPVRLAPCAYVNCNKDTRATCSRTSKCKIWNLLVAKGAFSDFNKGELSEQGNLLKQQIDMINPDIVVCCGVMMFPVYCKLYYESAKDWIGIKHLGQYRIEVKAALHICGATERVVISFFHPSLCRKRSNLFNELKGIIRVLHREK